MRYSIPMSILLILVIMLLCIVPSHLTHFVKQSFLYVMLCSVAQLTANQSIKFLVCDYTFGEDATEVEGWGLKTTLTRDSRFVGNRSWYSSETRLPSTTSKLFLWLTIFLMWSTLRWWSDFSTEATFIPRLAKLATKRISDLIVAWALVCKRTPKFRFSLHNWPCYDNNLRPHRQWPVLWTWYHCN